MEPVKKEHKLQFEQTWKIFEAVVSEFDDVTWKKAGSGYMIPAKLALHILLGVDYYIERKSEWGNRYAEGWASLDEESVPTQADILQYLEEEAAAFNSWLAGLELDAENQTFPWAGPTRSGVLVFLLRHTMYHLGEMNALLHVARDGEIDDMWMKGFS